MPGFSRKPVFQKLSSVKFLFFLIPVIIVLSIAGTLIPQGEEASWYVHRFGQPWAGILTRLQLTDIYHSFLFIGFLFLLALNLALCSLKIIGMLKKRPGVFVTHAAVMIILLGGMISGIWGKRGVLPLQEGETKQHVGTAGKGFHLPFSIRLKQFSIEYYEGERHMVQVSFPEEGWSEVLDVHPGSATVLHHGGLNLKVLAYYPDFIMGENGPLTRSQSPENPALRLELSNGQFTEQHWAFARFPDFHRDPKNQYRVLYQLVPGKIKQFKSQLEIVEDDRIVRKKVIYVNEPLRWQGYTIYQSGYDPENPKFSSLLVSKDPGVSVVYAGFIILPIGLFLAFYRRNLK